MTMLSAPSGPPPGPDPAGRADAADLASFGYEQQLHRKLDSFASFAAGFSLNGQLLSFGARLHRRTRTAAGYRLFRLPGPGIPRPGLVAGGDGPAAGIAVEVWDVSEQGVGWLLSQIPAPLGLGRVALADGTSVAGFVTVEGAVRDAEDVSRYGSWRRVLAAADGSPR